MKIYKKFIFIVILFSLFFAKNILAQNANTIFFVDSSFDASNRNRVDATLVRTSSKLNFYIETALWEYQDSLKRTDILKALDDLSVEFENNIYPTLTNSFGYEKTPGLDGERKITVFFHQMKQGQAGYFRTNDGYEKIQISTSNARNMVYISADLLYSPKIKVALAHEFMHLITFNQKTLSYGIEEDTWLDEARADYTSTILGYDDNSDTSNVQSRIKDFIESSSNSLTEWTGSRYDYASVSIFTHYLVDRYGIKILSESMGSRYVGIESINYVLEKYSYKERFEDVFTNWTISLVLNNCSIGREYCYIDKNFNTLRITPNINFLPISSNAMLSVVSRTKSWSGAWIKLIGGNGDLKIDFSVAKGLNFKVPYILEDLNGNYSVNFLSFDQSQKGEIIINRFSSKYKSLIIIPSLQPKIYRPSSVEPIYSYTYSASINNSAQDEDQELINKLLAQIDSLKQQIAILLAQQQGGYTGSVACQISKNLYYGMSNSEDVKCLQNFLKNQGINIYPQGLITGNFGLLTKTAVIKFQEKYGIDKTGFVGPLTRTKINQIMNNGG